MNINISNHPGIKEAQAYRLYQSKNRLTKYLIVTVIKVGSTWNNPYAVLLGFEGT